MFSCLACQTILPRLLNVAGFLNSEVAPTSHVRRNRVSSGVGGLSQPQAAHMEVDGDLKLALNAVVLCAGWVLSDHTLHLPHTVSINLLARLVFMQAATCCNMLKIP